MAKIELRDLAHSYVAAAGAAEAEEGPQFAIEGVNLAWEEGTAAALLGPSGCGKTTILNIISGLLHPTRGGVFIGGQDVTGLAPRDRHIAQVFQFPVVYDTITVSANLAFPLKNAGVSRRECATRVGEIAELLDLTEVLNVSAGKVSQADKQKVSLGRGIVRKDTAAILLDEPLTVIDPKEKYILRRKLRQVQRELNITMIYVTHDQHEALTFADSVTVLDRGHVVQVGSPPELHADPATPFVGYFIGSPGMNLLGCTFRNGTLDFGPFSQRLSTGVAARLGPEGGELRLGIRPEFVQTSTTEQAGWACVDVRLVENMGTHKVLTLGVNGLTIKSRAADDMSVAEGARVWVEFPEDKMKIFRGDEKVL
ncbi:ABC transporter ATP-binding protein [Verrucomicrobiota bacterium]